MKLEKLTALALTCVMTAGCSTGLSHLNQPPKMSAPGAVRNPVPQPTPARIVLTAPDEDYAEPEITPGSLWRSGPESLFGDRRARTKGDIVTVLIEIDEEAEMRNRTNRNKSGSDDVSVGALFGLNSLAQQVLPGGADLNPGIETSSTTSSTGDGLIQREERITLRIAATVTDVLPNGHLAISGSQEIRVNYELRELQMVGIIRREDISRDNVVTLGQSRRGAYFLWRSRTNHRSSKGPLRPTDHRQNLTILTYEQTVTNSYHCSCRPCRRRRRLFSKIKVIL